MYHDNDKISVVQLISILVIAILDVQILALPRDLVRLVGPDGWFVIVLLAVIHLGVLWCFLRTAELFPNRTLIGIFRAVFGRPLGSMLSIILTVIWLLQTARVVRMSAELVRFSVLDRTPNEVISLVFLLGALYMSRKGVEPVGRTAVLVAIGALSIAVLIPLVTWPEAEWMNLRPILYRGIGQELKAALMLAGQLSGLIGILILLPRVRNKPGEKKTIIPSVLILTTLPVLMLSILTLAVFGEKQTLMLAYPGLELVTSVDMPAIFLERLTVFYVGAWVLMSMMNLSIYLYLLAFMVGEIFDVRDSTPIPGLLAPVVYLVSRIPRNDAAVRYHSEGLSRITGAYMAAVLVIFFVAWIRGVRPQKKGERGS